MKCNVLDQFSDKKIYCRRAVAKSKGVVHYFRVQRHIVTKMHDLVKREDRLKKHKTKLRRMIEEALGALCFVLLFIFTLALFGII